MTIAVDLGRKATKQTNKQTNIISIQQRIKLIIHTHIIRNDYLYDIQPN